MHFAICYFGDLIVRRCDHLLTLELLECNMLKANDFSKPYVHSLPLMEQHINVTCYVPFVHHCNKWLAS